MRRGRRVTGLFITVCLLSIMCCMPVAAAEGYETDRYDVTVDVHENQTYDITEDIGVNFLEKRHGIYRYIPFKGTMYSRIDGKEVDVPYKAKVNSIDVSEEYVQSEENRNYVIQIGDPDKTITGQHDYQISYDYQMYNDEDDGSDLFYLNVLPTGWESSIKEASITIKMPKKFSEDDAEVSADVYGEADENDSVYYQVDGNEIWIDSDGELPAGTGITVRVMLPEDYFTGVASDSTTIMLTILLGIAGIVIMAGIWLRYGKDRRSVKTVEFYPPNKMSPAQLGYIIDGKVDKKDLISLIIYHAKLGYLKIEEKKKKFGRPEIVLHKVKAIPGSAPQYERTFFLGLFGNQQTVNLKDLGKDFYDHYISAEAQLEVSFEDPKTEKDTIFESNEKAVRIAGFIISAIVLVAGSILASVISGEPSDTFVFVFAFAFVMFVMGFLPRLEHKGEGGRQGIPWKVVAGILIFIAAASIYGCFALVISQPFIPWIYGIFTAVALISIGYMDKRTVEGAKLMGKIMGFKDFLTKVEKDKLEQLVEETPTYFYDILPYAYVLGVSDVWARNFEQMNVSPPNWYLAEKLGVFSTYSFIHHINVCSDAVAEGIHISTPGGASGGAFSGGGFSGGGAGGGGGGSW